ncbi:unknown [Clostridium sp. CAG:729]|nr:unknown [Clostridium sp. CAG:729]
MITLGIIGVVAAMTMPSLIQDKQNTERVSQLKKVYSSLSQAFIMAVAENGTPDEWGMAGMYDEISHYQMATKLAKHLKLSENCIDMDQTSIDKVCNPDKNLHLKSTSRSVILLDGTRVTFRCWNSQCKSNYTYANQNSALKNTCGEISVDLNGNKLPNENGRDRFQFYVTKTALVPWGIQDDVHQFEKACNRKVTYPYPGFTDEKMYACTAWVLYNENMDYLKCDDLSWKDKTKCK